MKVKPIPTPGVDGKTWHFYIEDQRYLAAQCDNNHMLLFRVVGKRTEEIADVNTFLVHNDIVLEDE